MPLWRVYTPPNLLTPSQKSALAQAITANYTRISLPAFYVTVLFIPLETSDIFVSGLSLDHPSQKTPQKFMRFAVEHIARHMPDLDSRKRMMERISGVVGAPIREIEKEMGEAIRWEISISEAPRELWRYDGLVLPMAMTEAEALWVKEDRPVKYY